MALPNAFRRSTRIPLAHARSLPKPWTGKGRKGNPRHV